MSPDASLFFLPYGGKRQPADSRHARVAAAHGTTNDAGHGTGAAAAAAAAAGRGAASAATAARRAAADGGNPAATCELSMSG
jgi:hypothetical protein